MDFTFTEEQQAVAQAAAGVFEGMVTPERVRAVEAGAERVDRDLWTALAGADLLGLCLPTDVGGGGLGMVEACLVLEAQGRCVAPVPLWSTLVLGALPLAAFGTGERRDGLLAGVARGETLLTAALSEVADDVAAGGDGRPSVEAARGADGGVVLTGTARAVPQAHVAERVLVPAATADGVVVALVDPTAPGASLEVAWTTNREIHPHLHLDGVAVPAGDLLAGGDPAQGRAVVTWMLERAWTGLCALQVGVCEAALAQTAAYLNEREQFGRPLATFQGTMLRAADAAIDTEAVRVTMWQAAWRLDAGRDAALAVNVAKWWAAEAGNRVVHATQHLHGGMGADVDYPIHRYFLWGKQLELQLGGPSAQLARLGRGVVADLTERRAST